MCRKRTLKDCNTRFCNYIQGPERQFCRLTPRYIMDPKNDCVIKKNYTKKNSEIFINEFVNGHLRKNKVNSMRKKVATRKIKNFLNKKIIEKKNAEELIKKLKNSLTKEEQQEIFDMISADKVSDLIKEENMYNPDIQFYFYSGSKNAPPGKGAREKIPTELFEEYKTSLSEFPEFRKMLSNFGEAQFHLDGLDWNSVEHYYQGSKFKQNNPDFYYQFSLNSGSELSKDPNMAKAYGGKTGKYKGKVVRKKSISIDPDFFGNNRGSQEMFDSQLAKFTQNENMKNMLLATKDAQLMHTIPRSSHAIPFDNLVYFRDLIKKGKI
jgi:predicted NAD-dependent protein-ADP-ribosyltransferase YbiA (DUF1768 family)